MQGDCKGVPEGIKKAQVFPLSQCFQTRDRRKLTYKQAEKKVCLRNLLTIMEILKRKIIDFRVLILA